MKFKTIENIIKNNDKLDKEDIVILLTNPEYLLDIAVYADKIKKSRFGNDVYYGNNININPTNICEVRCPLCAFSRDHDSVDAYVLSIEEILERVRNVLSAGLLEVHIVGGLYDKLKIDYYETLIKEIKRLDSELYIQGLTAVEIEYFSRLNGLSIENILERLKSAGLDSMPGGGAEIFNPEVRKTISPDKIDADKYFEVMEIAHKIGIKTNVTMLYGHIETAEDIADHLIRIRDFQDKSPGIMAFVPLTFYKKNTGLPDIPEHISGVFDLAVLTISRIVLNNVPHIKSLWTYFGKKMTQAALSFGVDDIGSTALDERIAAAAGAEAGDFKKTEELEELITEVKLNPVLCDSGYNTRRKGSY